MSGIHENGDVVLAHVARRLAAASVETDPYPYFFVDELFPADFYQQLRDNLPDRSKYQRLSDVSDLEVDYFQHRDQATLNRQWIEDLPEAGLRTFWNDTTEWLLGPALRQTAVDLLAPYMEQRYPGGGPLPEMTTEAELIRHRARYCLEPHTDLPSKVVVLLMYLPEQGDVEQLGTSVYRPLDPDFTDDGSGGLHPFKKFELVTTAPFRPNSAFGFLKNDRSFHGVEPISEEDGRKTSRDIIEWVVYDVPHHTSLQS